MTYLSLTARMSLMFMLAVIAVLTVAGLSFNQFSRHHFMMLDQQTLSEKLDSTQEILSNTRSHADIKEVLPQLKALLGAHHDLAAISWQTTVRYFLPSHSCSMFPRSTASSVTTVCGSGSKMGTSTEV